MVSPKIHDVVGRIDKLMSVDGVFPTAVPELTLSRFSKPSEVVALVYEPSFCLVVQGAKVVTLAGEAYRMDPAHSLLVSVDLPVEARIVEAKPSRPFLGLRLALDPAVVGELLADGAAVPPAGPTARAITATAVEPAIIEAVTRLVALHSAPRDVAALSPLILREITYRLLTSPQGARLRQIATAGAPAHRIARAIRWIKDHFAEPLSVVALAQHVGLSPSAFHLHFKNVTGLSPLQFQKRIRLQEGRRLMLGEGLDAASVAFQIGYESPSHFGREYRRMFGESPRRDVATIQAERHSTNSIGIE